MDKDVVNLDFLLLPTASTQSPDLEFDEWVNAGLEGAALEAARLWSRDQQAFSQPTSPAWQQRIAETLQQVLDEVKADPAAFNQRAASCS